MIGTEKEMLEEKVQILELQCDAANERIKTLEKELEENKLKWHDLRKNPEDLPKETGHYLTDDGEYIYDADRKEWRTLTCMTCWDFHWLDDEDVIAWTELPKFEDK